MSVFMQRFSWHKNKQEKLSMNLSFTDEFMNRVA
jgi:hypothetical protein